jgi:hypothetical protein
MLGKNSTYGTNPTPTLGILQGENADRQFITPYFLMLYCSTTVRIQGYR